MRLKEYSYEIEEAVKKCYMYILGRVPGENGIEYHSKSFKDRNIFFVSLGDVEFDNLRMRFILSEEFFLRYYEIKVLGINNHRDNYQINRDVLKDVFIFLFGYLPNDNFIDLLCLKKNNLSDLLYNLIRKDKIYRNLTPVITKIFSWDNDINELLLVAEKMMALEEDVRFKTYKDKLGECKDKRKYAYNAYILFTSFMGNASIKEVNKRYGFNRIFRSINYPIVDIDDQILNAFKNHKEFFYATSYDGKTSRNKLGYTHFDYKLLYADNHYMSYFLLDDKIGIFIVNKIVFIKEYGYGSPWNVFFEEFSVKNDTLFRREISKIYSDTSMKRVFEELKSDINFGILNKAEIKLGVFRRNYPNTCEYDYLMGLYYFKKDNISRAEKYVMMGLNRVHLHYDLCHLMGDIFLRKQNYSKAIQFYMRLMIKNASKNFEWILDEGGNLKIPQEIEEKIIIAISRANDNGISSREVLRDVNNELIRLRDSFKGRKELLYFDGGFKLVDLEGRMDIEEDSEKMFFGEIQQWAESYYDYRIGEVYKTYNIKPASKLIVPIMLLDGNQELKIKTSSGEFDYFPGNGMVERFRKRIWVDLKCSKQQDIEVVSSKDFVVANPVRLKPLPKRKIVINILLDALAFGRIKDSLELYMPNTKKFFDKGVIFENAYAPAEWTQNSMPSILTGIMPQKLQMYHPYVNLNLSKNIPTIIDNMKSVGFYTVNMCYDIPRSYTNGMYRSFDRQVNVLSIDQQIAKAIEILDHYPTDIFLNIHNLTVHESQLHSLLTRMTSVFDTSILDLDVMLRSDCYVKEQSSENLEARKQLYWAIVRDVDKKLMPLYEYLLENFPKENVFVSLISDHGSQSDNMKEFLLSREHTNTAFMLYGDMIPCRGTVRDEVVSGIDLYSVYERLFNFPECKRRHDSILPRILGGEGRDFAITQTIYPGQPYRMAINDLKYEFWFKTKQNVEYDGTYNAIDYFWRIFNQRTREETFKIELLNEYLSKARSVMKNLSKYGFEDYSVFLQRITESEPAVSLFLKQPPQGLYEGFFLFLDSILSQTFGGFKVFIIERNIDGQFEDCLKEYMNKDLRIMLVKSEHNSLGLIINKLLSINHFSYAIFFNEYRLVCPVMLRRFVDAANANDADIVYNLVLSKNEENISTNILYKGTDEYTDDVREIIFENSIDRLYEWKAMSSYHDRCLKMYSLRYLKEKRMVFDDLDEGVIELFDIRSFFKAEKIFKIKNSNLLGKMVKNNITHDASRLVDSMMKYLGKIDEFIQNQYELGIKDENFPGLVRYNMMELFNKTYFCYLNDELIEKITQEFQDVLQKNPKISRWWVSYLFKRNLNAFG